MTDVDLMAGVAMEGITDMPALGSIFMCMAPAARADYIAPCSPPDSVKLLPFPGGIPAVLLKA